MTLFTDYIGGFKYKIYLDKLLKLISKFKKITKEQYVKNVFVCVTTKK